MFKESENGFIIEMSTDILEKILDHSTDEIYVVDGETRIVFMNKICAQHYGLKRSEVIGKRNEELFKQGYWTPSIIPIVMQEKKPVTIKQTTYYGGELVTTAVPILNRTKEIELVVITAHEQNFKKIMHTDQEPADQNQLPNNIITNSQKMKDLLTFCHKIALVDSTILLQGESGTGKGAFAAFIHQMSRRKNGPFLTINCAAIPEELLESELFGYSQGAFTGASKSGKLGLIEAANNGTIFLDEIGELPLKIQAKLLQVIQEHRFLPVGGTEYKQVDIRILSATNRDLSKMVENKQFREDLYYRLNVIDLKIPPLRERPEDIVPLTYYFINRCNKKYGVDRLISQETLQALSSYSWPGNVRQLENMIERLVVTTESIITPADLPDIIHQHNRNHLPLSSAGSPPLPQTLDAALAEVEKQMVRRSYQKHRTTRKVAADLGVSQTKATKLIQKYCRDLGELE
ncbi:sigma 54-interacting transcriptional regulator [Brevibacillus agri]|uniref:sigma-54 interaction domain-containing protein n=1 Tax=Brevibacillus TaxID=55080 RepID=UPI0002717694|nr:MULTISPECIES: sigma 54-interacting transcriptional regulator [Brevibacillus]EJL42730.1 PAS domain S-box [Brevibacillus sp. CF112]MBG9566496.1 histidine kinase [Brevibacillus agri]MBY0050539.1 sigma 54-interacting transcriptional regulator [Brevibacillus agri]MDN4093379.1 sigma 54-interacting transcriptional regulator [Brevibacillus agri]MED1645311.1 sigma 54-interacting transcriptional regulator [Brevibacillus agri]